MNDLSNLSKTATARERAQAYRRRAIELLDISQSLRNETGRRILVQTAQEFRRMADDVERASRNQGDG